MSILLFIAAFICAIIGIQNLLAGDLIMGLIWIAAACVIGPGGYSAFRR